MPSRILALFMALLLLPAPLLAAEPAMQRFEPMTRVADVPLKLNGEGIRSLYSLKAYAIGLYLGAPADSLDSAMKAPGAKRIEIVSMVDVPAEHFNKPLIRGIKKNLPRDEYEAMQPRIKAFSEQVLAIGSVKSGSRLALDWIPGRGTRIVVDGQPSATLIEGEDFFRGLLAVWIGPVPTQDDLKIHLLAGRSAR
ncbi:MAG: transmembrane lipoprotein [Methyloversatilis sp. 12-65-5]|nr:MAG: transmembrane lipoprotein [Methyloversatilis sp. 12-65-5]